MKTISKLFLGLAASLTLSSCSLFEAPLEKLVVHSIKVVNPQTKYYVGDEFVEPAVMAIYEPDSNGVSQTKEVTKDVTFMGFDSSEVGKGAVDVIYSVDEKTYTTDFEYTIYEAPKLDKITVENPVTSYNVGDEFVKPTVIASYTKDKDGKASTKDVSDKATFQGFNSTKRGTIDVTVSYTEAGVTKVTSYSCYIQGELSKTSMKYTYDDFTNNNYFYIDSCPSIGKAKLLVIPLWFTDSSNFISTSKKDTVRSDIEKAYFGSTTDTGWNSVKTYYETESHGKLTLDGTVTDWYECGMSSASLAAKPYGSGDTASLVETAANWYFTNNPTDSRKNYDCNGDGYLDGVMCIYASPNYYTLYSNSVINYSQIDSYSNFWAYAFWRQDTSKKNVTNPGINGFFWASFDFMYGYTNVTQRTGNVYYYGDTSHCAVDTHTYIHEMGHVFGLEDYYDYNGVGSPAGSNTMQDHNVGGHDPYSVMALGWADPYIPDESMEISIKPFQESGDLILLTPKWNKDDSPFDEYLLLELYTPTGLNQFDSQYGYSGSSAMATTAGIRVWHVSSELISLTKEDFVNAPSAGSEVLLCYSNTFAGDDDGHIDWMVSLYEDISYANYSLLSYIRNSTTATYKANDKISSSNMFKAGDTFDMNKFKNQFVKSGKLDSGDSLGWSFTVKTCSSTGATIQLVKA